VYDIEDPANPSEVAHWVSTPPEGQLAPQSNDLFVDSHGLIWVTDRTLGGLAVLEPEPSLRGLMEEARL
jgi:streptogramin lyase